MSTPLIRLGTLGLAAFLAAGCAGTPAEKSAQATPAAAVQSAPAATADLGIRVEALRLSAADYMLDFRFRITDPERATAFFSRKTEIHLVDPDSGARLTVPNTPKLGKLRQVARKDMPDRSYFILFANPGKFVRPGSRLTLVVGETRLENLVVEGGGEHHAASTPL